MAWMKRCFVGCMFEIACRKQKLRGPKDVGKESTFEPVGHNAKTLGPGI